MHMLPHAKVQCITNTLLRNIEKSFANACTKNSE